MFTKRRVIIATSALLVLAAGAFAFLLVALAPFAQRDTEARAAFGPLSELNPEILDNAFGVYVVTFTPDSLLADDTAAKLLSLNHIPIESDLTLNINTPLVTDLSIPVLLQLASVDRLYLSQTAISPDGVAALSSSLPNGTIVVGPAAPGDAATPGGGEQSQSG